MFTNNYTDNDAFSLKTQRNSIKCWKENLFLSLNTTNSYFYVNGFCISCVISTVFIGLEEPAASRTFAGKIKSQQLENLTIGAWGWKYFRENRLNLTFAQTVNCAIFAGIAKCLFSQTFKKLETKQIFAKIHSPRNSLVDETKLRIFLEKSFFWQN